MSKEKLLDALMAYDGGDFIVTDALLGFIRGFDMGDDLPVKVFAEIKHQYAEHIASFSNENVYMKCLPGIESWASKNHFDIVTESID